MNELSDNRKITSQEKANSIFSVPHLSIVLSWQGLGRYLWGLLDSTYNPVLAFLHFPFAGKPQKQSGPWLLELCSSSHSILNAQWKSCAYSRVASASVTAEWYVPRLLCAGAVQLLSLLEPEVGGPGSDVGITFIWFCSEVRLWRKKGDSCPLPASQPKYLPFKILVFPPGDLVRTPKEPWQ